MSDIHYFVDIDGYCPYLEEDTSINVEYKEVRVMGSVNTKNYFLETNCEYYNDCQLYTECPLIKHALNSV